MAIIEVNHVTKEYCLGQMKSLKESFLRNIDRLRGREAPKREPFKALDDIDFADLTAFSRKANIIECPKVSPLT